MQHSKSWFHYNKHITLFLALILMCTINTVNSAVNADKTRVIFNVKNKTESLRLINSSDYPFLIQTWIDDGDPFKLPEESQTAVITNPPIFKMAPKEIKSLKLILTSMRNLPKDRESVYWLNIYQVPPNTKLDEKEKNAQRVVLTFRMRLKIFIRPEDIGAPKAKDGDKLSFIRQDNEIIVNNPTPWHMTLSNINSNNVKFNDFMIKPFSKMSLSIPKNKTLSNTIKFNLIDDLGNLQSHQLPLEAS